VGTSGERGGWKAKGESEEGRIWGMYLVFMYENRAMKPDELVPIRVEGR
jgi:hypothetical protein